MERNKLIDNIEIFVKQKISDYDGGHDWWHIERVRRLALYLNKLEGSADPFMIEVVALLHDSADSKFAGDDIEKEYAILGNFINSIGLEHERDHILEIIRNISFSNKKKSGNLADPVLHIVQDADRLDAIGAIGIARAFTYGGFKKNVLFNPEIDEGMPSTIKHFYDKLLILKEKMNTGTAKIIAYERHHFMEIFLNEFYKEWEFVLPLKK
jgi:uncharacterized protein